MLKAAAASRRTGEKTAVRLLLSVATRCDFDGVTWGPSSGTRFAALTASVRPCGFDQLILAVARHLICSALRSAGSIVAAVSTSRAKVS